MDKMKKALEVADRYLPLFTGLLAVIIGIAIAAVGQSDIDQKKLLWAIWVTLVFLATSEFLKRVGLLSRIEDDIKEIKRNKIVQIIKLEDREHMYQECAKLIKRAKVIIDTTWGKSPPIQPKFNVAREAYRKAAQAALKRGASYREIYTISDERKDDLIKSLGNRDPNTIRILKDIIRLPLIEFMIFDDETVVFSRVYSDREGPNEPKYFLVHNPELAKLFHCFFEDMWGDAIEIEVKDGSILNKKSKEEIVV
jgi:hypothetical protein